MAKQSFKFFTPRDKPKKRGPRQHKKSLNKNEKRQKNLNRYKGQGWHYSHNILYSIEERGFMKKLTITSKNISQKQWTNLILELNLLKKQWHKYADIEIQAPGIKKIIAWGTSNYDSKVVDDE